MNRQTAREELIESWIAETNSDFYTDTVVNHALDHELRLFCAESGAGPFASFEETGDGVKRSWNIPVELVDLWRVDYGTTKDEITFLPFQQFSNQFGTDWISGTATGQPDAYGVLGSHAIIFEPIPASLVTWRMYGPIIPDAPASDTSDWLVLDADAYTIVKRAYVWLVERNLTRLGAQPPNYERAIAEAKAGTELAKRRVGKMYGSTRAAGRIATGMSSTLLAQYLGPRVNWP